MAKRLTDQDKKKIIADYINNQNFSETGRMNKVSTDTVIRLVRKNEDIKQKLALKKQQTTQDMLQFIQSQYPIKQNILNNLLKSIESKSKDEDLVTLKELSTAYGIIMDKELKMIELQRGTGSREDLMKVEELLEKIKGEAYK